MIIVTMLRRIVEIVTLALVRAWETGVLQGTVNQALLLLIAGGSWYFRNLSRTGPATLGGGLGFWLARLSDTYYTRLIFSNLGVPIQVYYLLMLVLGAAIALSYFSQGSER